MQTTVGTLDPHTAVSLLRRTRVLELAEGDWIARHENMALIGSIGRGKTHIAVVLDLAACEEGHRVRFCIAAGLVSAPVEAQEAHRLGREVECCAASQDGVPAPDYYSIISAT